MITPPTKSFFVIHVSGMAADFISDKFSPEVTSDIREAVLISDDFETDIEAHHGMDKALTKLRKPLGRSLAIETKYNPLYIPSTPEAIDNVMESDTADNFRFTGFDGNPFTMKSVSIGRADNQGDLISARVACHQFDLPSYAEIIEAQEHKVIN